MRQLDRLRSCPKRVAYRAVVDGDVGDAVVAVVWLRRAFAVCGVIDTGSSRRPVQHHAVRAICAADSPWARRGITSYYNHVAGQ